MLVLDASCLPRILLRPQVVIRDCRARRASATVLSDHCGVVTREASSCEEMGLPHVPGGQVTRAAVQDLFWKDPDCDRSPNFTFVLTEPMLSSFLFAGEQNQNHGATGPGRTMNRQPRLSRPLSSPELQGRWQKPRCSSHTHKPIRNFTRTESFCGLKTKDKLLYFFS